MKVIRLITKNDGSKEWVEIQFDDNTRWLPKFDELGYALQLICELEDKKYPNGKGRKMVEEYIVRAMKGENVLKLNGEYQIPSPSVESKFELYSVRDDLIV